MTALTALEKAERVRDALDQLAAEIAGDRSYDDATALLIFDAIDRFNLEASPKSKAHFYDIITGA